MSAKRVLVAPLDWGLGHASRSIPLIRELIRQGHEAIIAVDGQGEFLLREEFPQLKFIFLRGYRLSYSRILPAWLKIIFQLPGIVYRMVAENFQLKKIIRENKIDVVISDNRFGLWNKNIPCIYITHQLLIKCPSFLKFFEPLLHRIHGRIIKRYDQCWVPDFKADPNLSGELSHKYPPLPNTKYIGPLSRFGGHLQIEEPEYDLCIVLSGPEPARSDFERIVTDQLPSFNGKAILILGRPGYNYTNHFRDNITVRAHLNAQEMERVITSSRLVLCRSGYSGIMDLIATGKEAVIVPTPGQTEQEYLAGYLDEKKIFRALRQDQLDLNRLIHVKNDYSPRYFSAAVKRESELKETVRDISDYQ